ncbi:lysosomal enzyme trafficking factor-like [Diadema antillarum]|uniref:lysosomal enzyme trafficking factor-like n=1 Tax=Diadema antillarum TaxID=105358 RepID=UPI003A8BEC7C
MAWIFLVFYLGISVLMAYFIFEISDQYNILALEHVQTYTDTLRLNPHQLTWYMSIMRRVVALPFWFWVMVFILPYLQVFCIIIACTRSDPMNATVMVVPVFLCMKVLSIGNRSQQTVDEDLPRFKT